VGIGASTVYDTGAMRGSEGGIKVGSLFRSFRNLRIVRTSRASHAPNDNLRKSTLTYEEMMKA